MRNRPGITLIRMLCIVLATAVVAVGSTLAVQYWLRGRDISKIAAEESFEGVTQKFEDPMTCVDAYYRAIVKCDHRQYQFCVVNPLPVSNFLAKAVACAKTMKEGGFKRYREPVRGRTDFKEIRGFRGADVFAISPWTREEVRYSVISQGQSWKIVEEK